MPHFWKRKPTATRATPRIQNTSTELESYLEYYSQLQDPGHAVLITGAWGTGKSHQTKEAIGANSLYISLFGLHTAEEIYSSVFAKMFPTKAKLRGAGKSIQDISVEFGGAGMGVGGLASGVINAFIRESVDSSKTLIFDDLERCSLPLKDCLGAINKYVEHHGCRVVVIAHDEKLTTEFLEAKEKIFGHVITALPQHEPAFDKFIEKYDTHNAYHYLSKNKSSVIRIMKDSKCESLRILKHTLEDLSRVYESLLPEHISNDKALSELTCLFTALSFEVRNGSLNKEDILSRNRAGTIYYLRLSSQNGNTAKPAIMEASERHPNINITSQLLNNEVLASMLFNGIFDESLIRQSLNNSLSYTSAEELAPWRVFMSMDEINDTETERAAHRLIRQFENREAVDPGEILHLFAFRLLKAQIGFIPRSIDETVDDCKNYLEDLLTSNRMPFIARTPNRHLEIANSYGGYAYWVDDLYKPQFDELLDKLIEYGDRSIREKYPAIAKDLLTLMKNDSENFIEKLSGKAEGEDWYAYMDVLSAIQPQKFVETLMDIHPKDCQNIAKALRGRYNLGELGKHLKNEADWLLEVMRLLEQELDSSPPLRKMRLERSIPWQLKTMAQEIVSAK